MVGEPAVLQLICTATHAAVPALRPSDRIRLDRNAAGGLTLVIPATPAVLRAIARAMEDGALALPPDAPPPSLGDIEAHLEATRERLVAHLEAATARHYLDLAG